MRTVSDVFDELTVTLVGGLGSALAIDACAVACCPAMSFLPRTIGTSPTICVTRTRIGHGLGVGRRRDVAAHGVDDLGHRELALARHRVERRALLPQPGVDVALHLGRELLVAERRGIEPRAEGGEAAEARGRRPRREPELDRRGLAREDAGDGGVAGAALQVEERGAGAGGAAARLLLCGRLGLATLALQSPRHAPDDTHAHDGAPGPDG